MFWASSWEQTLFVFWLVVGFIQPVDELVYLNLEEKKKNSPKPSLDSHLHSVSREVVIESYSSSTLVTMAFKGDNYLLKYNI